MRAAAALLFLSSLASCSGGDESANGGPTGGAGGTSSGGTAGVGGGASGSNSGGGNAGLGGGGSGGSGGGAAGVPGWKLVFQDDFDGAAVDESAWGLYDSPGHAGNGLRRPEAISVKNGWLTITAQMSQGELVSGGMAMKQNFKYGRFEFRVRTDVDPSATMSGVVLTWPESGNWPSDGENDMYETGHDSTRKPFSTFIHYGADNQQYYTKHDADGAEWHVMAMEWEADEIRIYRDGPQVWNLTDAVAIPDVPHHMTIQLDAFGKSLPAPVQMHVDWVRIYQR